MPADPLARLLRTAWLAALGGCVVSRYGAPTTVSALAIAGAIAAVAVATPEVSERRTRFSRLTVVAIGVALAAAVVALLQGAARPLQTPWITLFGIPFAFAAADFDGPLVPARRQAAALWCVALALGVGAIEAWRTPAVATLLAIAAASGVADAAWSTARAARLKGIAPLASARRRALLAALLLALASVAGALAAYELLQRVPRLLSTPERTPSAAEDRLARQSAAPPRLDPERAIALVRAADDARAADLPQPLYLRESLLDEVHELDGFTWLAPRHGEARPLADGDDGVVDHRIAGPDGDRRALRKEVVEFQVTLLEVAPARDRDGPGTAAERALLVVPGTRWIEGDALELQADGSLHGAPVSSGGLTYKDGAAPARAFGRVDPPTEALAASQAGADVLLALPADFDGRALALDLGTQATAGARDDFDRAARIAAWFREHGLLDPARPLERWFDFFAAPAPRGRADHFAQACALVFRLAGLPARVVVGYRAVDFDAAHRRWRVRAGDRHAWVEAAFAGGVWIAFDPTPDRVAPRAASGDPLADEFGARLSEATSLQSVQQSIDQQRPWWIGIALLVAVVAFLAFPTIKLGTDPTGRRRAPEGVRGAARRAWRYWHDLEELCARFELAAAPTQTASEFATRVNAAAPAEVDALARLLSVYHSCRFGGAELASDDERHAQALLTRLPLALQHHRERARAARRNTR